MTILGKHTISETRDLMATVIFRIKQTDALLVGKTLGTDAKTVETIARWAAWKANWKKVSDAVADKLSLTTKLTFMGPENIASENEYNQIKCAINKSCDDTHADPGDFFNVIQGIEQLTGKRIDESNAPQPSPDDPDLAALKKVDAAIKTGEAAAKAAKDAAKSGLSVVPWYVWAGGAVVVGGVAFAYVSPFLPRRG